MRLLHISDLHVGSAETPQVQGSLEPLIERVGPELIVVTGDLTHRGRRDQHERAAAQLRALGPEVVAVPGNHDIPYTVPARITSPWEPFEAVFGTTDPVLRTPNAVVCGLNSGRPWRHQGGKLSAERIASVGPIFAGAPAGALRVVTFHHHLAGAPWRASRKFPLKHRNTVLHELTAAGAELVLGGHIHQATAVERHSFQALADDDRGSVILATAPGFGRPRPDRLGEANGLHVVRWTANEIEIETRIWRGGNFEPTSTKRAPRIHENALPH